MIASVITPIILVGILGAGIAIFLAIADKKLAVPVAPLVEEVTSVLPMGNCGNCGFAGCTQFAEKVVHDPLVSPSLCTPGGSECAEQIARITGKEPGTIEVKKAVARCSGCTDKNCTAKYIYNGLSDCDAAAQMFAGEKSCEYGCLGLGNCERICPFDAITMDENHLPLVDEKKCTGCGVCATACPRNIIQIVPSLAASIIKCMNKDKGGATRKICDSGCMGCRICEKSCPHGAMKVVNNLCEIDYDKCRECKEPVCLVVQCKPHVILPNYGVAIPDIEPPTLKKRQKTPAA
jgi:Na+-translocating ferredoxin:NAD+ oxidoreductase RNF subunit RnfB